MFIPHLSTASEEHSYTARTHDCTRTKITRKPLKKKRSLGPCELGLLRTETLHNLLQSILLAHFNSSLTMGFSMKKRATVTNKKPWRGKPIVLHLRFKSCLTVSAQIVFKTQLLERSPGEGREGYFRDQGFEKTQNLLTGNGI